MKRAQDKIKDLVEPQEFDQLRDFAADPARALAAYRFTDATSDLLARWLDALADLPRGLGAAHALAGMRGVGKSHTLATFGALISAADEHRHAQITDPHVASSARRLVSRRHRLVRVARGTRPTLRDELVEAFATSFGGSPSDWAGDPAAWLAHAAASAQTGATMVILVDTAFGREARVKRDDGPLLSELALAAREANAFVALALDDDIAGAEGINVALARTFQIDYLEPEHLYHVANMYVLRKHAPARDALHEIYLTLRQSVPNFNWSEPRFAALYPVHPLVADTAASVRLYAPAFAFLPFAAHSARNAVNRPALSLILLDEVFDHSEDELRRSDDLKDAFRVYDELATNSVSQFPAMQRLQVRLVLKTLFILSLDGRGATARDLCAALLFQNESSHDGRVQPTAIERVEELLQRLIAYAPQGSLSAQADGEETRYRFQVSAAADFDAALDAASESPSIDATAINELLHTLPRARFQDWPLGEDETRDGVNFQVMWRGMPRAGRLTRQTSAVGTPASLSTTSDEYDWELRILDAGDCLKTVAGDSSALPSPKAPLSIVWQPAECSPEELSVLRRLVALQRADQTLGEFGETARAAANTLNAQAERIWSRLYVDEGMLLVGGEHVAFSAEARSVQTLGLMLADALAPCFEARFPQHPRFDATPTEPETARLVDNLFGGGNVADAAVQQLAETYAVPLGLATRRGDILIPETGDAVLTQPWVREVLTLVDRAGSETVPLAAVHQSLHSEPYGLLRETQYLVLAALVAQRRIELSTATGDRISRRTLASSIKWDEVAGVCRAAEIHHNAEELTNWARLLTDDATLSSIANAGARESVRDALAAWLATWRAGTVLREFDALPDAGLTTRAWDLAAAVRRTFGAAADTVEAALAGNLTLEEGLQRVADIFGDAPEQLSQHAGQLAALRAYTAGIVRRESVRSYLSAAELTGLEEIESARRELLLIADDPHSLFDEARTERFDLLWQEFQAHYIQHYADTHASCVGHARDHKALDELTRGAEWRDFEALASLPFVAPQLWEEATSFLAEVKNAHCDLPVGKLLAHRPRCACGFRLSRAAQYSAAAPLLVKITERGRAAYRRTLTLFQAHLTHALNLLASEADAETARHAYTLAHLFVQRQTPPLFTHADARLIALALEKSPCALPLRASLPQNFLGGLLTRDELAARWQQWFDELPHGAALVEITFENNSDAA